MCEGCKSWFENIRARKWICFENFWSHESNGMIWWDSNVQIAFEGDADGENAEIRWSLRWNEHESRLMGFKWSCSCAAYYDGDVFDCSTMAMLFWATLTDIARYLLRFVGEKAEMRLLVVKFVAEQESVSVINLSLCYRFTLALDFTPFDLKADYGLFLKRDVCTYLYALNTWLELQPNTH